MTTILFIPVKQTNEKLRALHQIAHRQFAEKSPLFFLASDRASCDFLDRLLWSASTFLPHPSSLLAIGLEVDPQFPTIFNLRPTPLSAHAKQILEFEDHTSPEKLQLSKQRYQYYRDHNFRIEYSVQF